MMEYWNKVITVNMMVRITVHKLTSSQNIWSDSLPVCKLSDHQLECWQNRQFFFVNIY